MHKHSGKHKQRKRHRWLKRHFLIAAVPALWFSTDGIRSAEVQAESIEPDILQLDLYGIQRNNGLLVRYDFFSTNSPLAHIGTIKNQAGNAYLHIDASAYIPGFSNIFAFWTDPNDHLTKLVYVNTKTARGTVVGGFGKEDKLLGSGRVTGAVAVPTDFKTVASVAPHSDSDGGSDGNSDGGSDGNSDGGSDGNSDGGSDGHDDNGHGNDADGVDQSNPGQSTGANSNGLGHGAHGGSDAGSDGGSDGNSDCVSDGGSDNQSELKVVPEPTQWVVFAIQQQEVTVAGQATPAGSDGGSDGKSDGGSDGHDDNGHGNDADGVDQSNPGQSTGVNSNGLGHGAHGGSDGGSDGASDGGSDGASDGGSDGGSDGNSDCTSDGGSDAQQGAQALTSRLIRVDHQTGQIQVIMELSRPYEGLASQDGVVFYATEGGTLYKIDVADRSETLVGSEPGKNVLGLEFAGNTLMGFEIVQDHLVPINLLTGKPLAMPADIGARELGTIVFSPREQDPALKPNMYD